MRNKMLNINIDSEKKLFKACDFLHDAECDINTIKYDKEAGEWEIVFQREYFDDLSKVKSERKLLIFSKISFPVIETVLRLSKLKSYEMKDKSKMEICMFNECQKSKGAYKFLFCQDMEMFFAFQEGPSGSLVDRGLMDKTKSFYTIGNWFDRKRKAKKVITRDFIASRIDDLLNKKVSEKEFGDEMFNYYASIDDKYSYEEGHEELLEDTLDEFLEMHDVEDEHCGYKPHIPSREELIHLKERLLMWEEK